MLRKLIASAGLLLVALLAPAQGQFNGCRPGFCGAGGGAPPHSAPVFVNAGTYAQTGAATTLTAALPTSRTTGNLLIAYVKITGASAGTSISVSSGWTVALSFNSGSTRAGLFAYAYVTGSEAAPVFTPNTTQEMIGQVYQYSGTLASSPIGATNINNGGGTTITCTATTTTAANSLVVEYVTTNVSTAPSAFSGWNSESTTNSSAGSTTVSDLVFASSGSSANPPSLTSSTANYTCGTLEIKAN